MVKLDPAVTENTITLGKNRMVKTRAQIAAAAWDEMNKTATKKEQFPRPLQKLLARMGKRWNVMICRRLLNGPRRPSELHKSIGNISMKVLAQTLNDCMKYGFIERQGEYCGPTVYYQLTPLGESMCNAIQPLVEWITEHEAEIEEAEKNFVPSLPKGGIDFDGL